MFRSKSELAPFFWSNKPVCVSLGLEKWTLKEYPKQDELSLKHTIVHVLVFNKGNILNTLITLAILKLKVITSRK